MDKILNYVKVVVSGGNASATDLAELKVMLEAEIASAKASVKPAPKRKAKAVVED